MIPEYTRPVWVEIDLDCLAYNIRLIREFVGYDVNIMGVVQGDAFGAGIPGTVDTLIEYGIDMLGVSILDEALLIRKKRPDIPVLIFGYTSMEHSDLLVKYNLTQSVYCWEQAEELSFTARRLKRYARIHLRINTGIDETGFEPTGKSAEIIGKISKLPYLELEGIYSGCPVTKCAGDDSVVITQSRYRLFSGFVSQLEHAGIFFPLKHFTNSAGTLYYPAMHMDMVRAGVMLFAAYPFFQEVLPLKQVLSLKAKVASVKHAAPECHGKDRQGKRMVLATLPLGYGDIYSGLLDGKGEVLIKGKRAPVTGRIFMDRCTIDVTHIPGSCIKGDEAVILGKQGEDEITMEELSKRVRGHIGCEFMFHINNRVPRVYKKEGNPLQVHNGLLGM